MAKKLSSPLDGRVTSSFGGQLNRKRKIILAFGFVAVIPLAVSTFAASVTIGTGSLEFGQGSQQAVACDPQVFASISEEWHSQPTDGDPSAGFFRVKSLTISNLDLIACKNKKLRVRLIDTVGNQIPLGSNQQSYILQITLPNSDQPQSTNDSNYLHLGYLNGDGVQIDGLIDAQVLLNLDGTSVYDGSTLSATSADITFYVDPSTLNVNIDGQNVGRATVETVNNPST